MSHNMKNSTAMINVACAILFLIFSFCYMYFLQADLLGYAQYVWSGGIRHLGPMVWTLLITFPLMLVYLGVKAMVTLPRQAQFLTLFPSALLLGTLTSLEKNAAGEMVVTNWWWIAIVLLVLYIAGVRVLAGYSAIEGYEKHNGLLSKTAMVNYLGLLLLMLITCGIGNTDATIHHRLKMERHINEGRYADALSVAKDVWEGDSMMTMLTLYSLSAQGELGEKAFNYVLTGRSKSLLPQPDGTVGFAMNDGMALWRHIGAVPGKWKGDVKSFLKQIISSGMATENTENYLLMAYLLERDVDGFVSELKHYYDFRTKEEVAAFEENIEKQRKKMAKTIGEEAARDSLPGKIFTPAGKEIKSLAQLPKHYKEALMLYVQLHPNKGVTYENTSLATDWDDFRALLRGKTNDKKANEYALRDAYFGTYWYYFYR